MAAAGRVMGGLAAAGKAVVDEVTGQRAAPPAKAPDAKPEDPAASA